MGRTALWTASSGSLRAELAEGRYPAGAKLPTEAALAQRFGVNRHTVRRALADLAEDGLVTARRGAGVFVAQTPTDYPIGRRVRFHQNLQAAGLTPKKQVLLFETVPATAEEADALHLPEGAPVHRYEGISFADRVPLALSRSVFPADRLPDLRTPLLEHLSITQALAQCGVADYTRAWTRVTAVRAGPDHAVHLGLREGDPMLRSVGVNIDPDGVPVEYGRTWFAGDRVTLTLDGD